MAPTQCARYSVCNEFAHGFSSNRAARNTEGAAGFMVKFITSYLYSMRATKLGYKPLPAFFCANLDRKRQIWSAAWGGLHHVSHSQEP